MFPGLRGRRRYRRCAPGGRGAATRPGRRRRTAGRAGRKRAGRKEDASVTWSWATPLKTLHHPVVHLERLAAQSLGGEALRYVAAAAPSHVARPLRIVEQRQDGRGQPARIARRHDETGPAVLEDLGRPADRGGDGGDAAGEGLLEDRRGGVAIDRRQDGNVQGRRDLGHVVAEPPEEN